MQVVDESGAIGLGMLALFFIANFVNKPAVLYTIAGGMAVLTLLAMTL